MESIQTIGIDLPLKALVWRDASGTTWLSYNNPAWLAERHGLDGAAAVNVMRSALDAVAKGATAKQPDEAGSLHLTEQFGGSASGPG
jgi:uncharacterized protein (DUF302 family)